MNVLINGESRDLPEGSTLQDVISLLQLQGRRLAIEINTEIVPRSLHTGRRLCEGDRIEIVHAIGGG
ncbi:MAG TPA: sulfur carrier protein ThiS [Gammaproteobacteria bacterium]|nr:sulfur carrier protein ThiS [Gammaproteobacteria bacterium]